MRTQLVDGARRAVADAYGRSERALAWLVGSYADLWDRGWRWRPVAVLAAPLLAVCVLALVLATAVGVLVAAAVTFGGIVAVVAAPWVALAFAVTALAGSDEPSRTTGPLCEPSYVGVCVPDDALDVDCRGAGGAGPYAPGFNFRVRGTDPYNLDRDDDGIACEAPAG